MVREPDGSIHYYDGVMTDITTRRQLEERLLRTARLELATALGMGLAHEINNALSTLSLHSYLLSRRMPTGNEDVAHHLQIIEQTVQRTAGLIQHFRELAQPTPTSLAPVSVSSLLEEIVATFGERLREQGVALDLSLADDLPRIHGDRTGLYEAFSAVVKNAIEALPAGGLLSVHTSAPRCATTAPMPRVSPSSCAITGRASSNRTCHEFSNRASPARWKGAWSAGLGLGWQLPSRLSARTVERSRCRASRDWDNGARPVADRNRELGPAPGGQRPQHLPRSLAAHPAHILQRNKAGTKDVPFPGAHGGWRRPSAEGPGAISDI